MAEKDNLFILLKRSPDEEPYNLVTLEVAGASPTITIVLSLLARVKLLSLLQTCNITQVRYTKKGRKNMADNTQ